MFVRRKVGALRAAIVGAGLMGRWHAHAIALAGSQVVAVADVNSDAARALAARSGARSFCSLAELLSDVHIDVAHICAPLSAHGALTAAAIEARVHVLVEKPLAETAEATRRLYARAADRAVLLAPVHQFLFQEGVARTLRDLPSLGNIVHADGVFCSAGAGDADEIDRGGDGVVADILPHPLSLFEALWPGSLDQAEWTAVRPAAGELRAHAWVGRSTLSLLVSMSARPPRADLWLGGTGGSVHLDLFHGFALWEAALVSRFRKAARPLDLGVRLALTAGRNLGRRTLVRAPAYPGLNALIRSFYEAIQNGGPTPISAESAIAVAYARERILAAAASSSALGSTQR